MAKEAKKVKITTLTVTHEGLLALTTHHEKLDKGHYSMGRLLAELREVYLSRSHTDYEAWRIERQRQIQAALERGIPRRYATFAVKLSEDTHNWLKHESKRLSDLEEHGAVTMGQLVDRMYEWRYRNDPPRKEPRGERSRPKQATREQRVPQVAARA